MQTNGKPRGFSLVEMMVVVAVLGIVVTAAMPSFGALVDKQRVDGVATQLASDLQFARSEAVLRNQGVRISLRAEEGRPACYVIHTGAADECHCQALGPARCEGSAQQIKTVSLADDPRIGVQASAASTLFDPAHGTASPTSTWRVAGPRGLAVNQVVNLLGRVRSCSPLGTMPNYRPC